jgi:phenylacetate-coenzyme A ligase PaaK-like adenylate-forming protein
MTMSAYEEQRLRHCTYMAGLIPEFLGRLAWSREQIEAERTRALRALLRHAVDRSPWHRTRLRGLDVDRFTADRIAELPTMTKANLMTNWDDIVTLPGATLAAAEAHVESLTTDRYFMDDHHVIASGGSSGTRGVFLYDWHGWAVSFLGLTRGPMKICARAGVDLRVGAVGAANARHATGAIPQTFALPDVKAIRAPVTLPLAEIVDILNDSDATFLLAYSSMLGALAQEANAGRLRLRPIAVWATSEPLLPETRKAVEVAFGVPVLTAWAASESNGGAFSCESGPGFHIGEDVNAIEPVDGDGRPVPPGIRSAKILVTNFYNLAMPLVRYEITDEFELRPDPCPCGSAYVKAADVLGRTDDVFDYPGGVSVHPHNFRTVLTGVPAVVEYQVRQTPRGADVAVVANGDVDAAALARKLAAGLEAVGVKAADVHVRRVDAIPRQSTGKLKRFVPLG